MNSTFVKVLLLAVVGVYMLLMTTTLSDISEKSTNDNKEYRLKMLSDISKYDLNEFKEIGKIETFKTYDKDYNYQEITINDKTIFVNIKHEEIPLNSNVLSLNKSLVNVYCFAVDSVINICRMGK